jgi:REP element-mobilizing transposase RayT
MPQSVSSILIHLIFSTKNREPFITPAIEPELHPYIAKILRELKSPCLALNGTSDHIHILFALSRIITIAALVEEVKTNSSKWIKTKGREFKNFHWQRGYGAFSVGQSDIEVVKSYIRNQKEHHKRVTFQDEYREFLKSYGIDFDERYVWD